MSENTSGGFVIAGEAQMLYAALLQVAFGLSLEICTSLKLSSRQSALQRAKSMGIVDPTSRSKKAALTATIGLLKEMNPSFEVKGSIQKALDHKK